MKENKARLLLVISPYVILVVILSVLFIINKEISSPYDTSWKLRQFVLAIFILAGLIIVPNLLHLNVIFLKNKPKIIINLQHHSVELRTKHEFLFKGQYYCAGCTGSAIGIVLSETMLVLYFFAPEIYNPRLVSLFSITGLVLIAVTFVRYFYELRPNIRLTQHVCLFPGIALLIISLDIIAMSAFIMIIMLPVWLLFIFTRIFLAKIDHSNPEQNP